MSSETVLGIQGNSEGLYADVCKIIPSAQSEAYRAINVALVQRNWLIGKRIAEDGGLNFAYRLKGSKSYVIIKTGTSLSKVIGVKISDSFAEELESKWQNLVNTTDD